MSNDSTSRGPASSRCGSAVDHHRRPARAADEIVRCMRSLVGAVGGWSWKSLAANLFCDEHFSFESIGVAEEETAHGAEVVDVAVAGTVFNEPSPYRFEALCGRRLQAEVVEPPASPHGRLTVGLGIAVDRHHIELGVGPDANH